MRVMRILRYEGHEISEDEGRERPQPQGMTAMEDPSQGDVRDKSRERQGERKKEMVTRKNISAT